MADAEILLRVERGLGHITLNRPKVLNSLTLGMIRAINKALTDWERDDSVRIVVIDGAGDRGLCAGGDIRLIYNAARSGAVTPAIDFWREEYPLNARLKTFVKPIVALMSGLVIGGGVGLSAHVRHRIVTETTELAMPEASIGFVPDVGGTFLLSRAPGELGTHIALTGARVGPADAIALGLANMHVKTDALTDLVAALGTCSVGSIGLVLREFASEPRGGEIVSAKEWIDAAYRTDDVETVLKALADRPEPLAAQAEKQIRQNSPTSLKVTLRALRTARQLDSLEACLAMEFRIAMACLAGHEMTEGIRAAVIDKDRTPRWSPDRLEDVTASMVERHFQHLGSEELTFAS